MTVPSKTTDVCALEDPERKKLRNRLSQRAFRRRRAEHLRELQKLANTSNQPQSEEIKAVQEENTHLRKQLVEIQSKLSRLIATMQALSGSVSHVLGESTNETSKSKDVEFGRSGDLSLNVTQDDVFGLEGPTSHVIGAVAVGSPSPDLLTVVPGSAEGYLPIVEDMLYTDSASDSGALQAQSGDFSRLAPQIPNIWDLEYQMGLPSYANALSGCQHSSLVLGKPWTETNSPFSDHISVLCRLMQGKIEQIRLSTRQPVQYFYPKVLTVLALFNSLTRPDAMAWYAKTRFYHIADLTTWQLYPCAETFERVHHLYRPTKMQLQHQYPTIIDWIPFPSIRDRLIQLHAANPNIDHIFCDTVSSYVVEGRMSDFIRGAPATRVYIRVTDVAENIASTEECKDIEPFTILPTQDMASLFSSPVCSRAVFRLLNMDRGVSHYKLDPAFFGTYPELFDPEADITAKGIPLRPNLQVRLTYPKPLDPPTYQTYRSFIDFSISAPPAAPPATIESTLARLV